MMRSLYSGVSGLKTHQTKMDVIGNNIANVNTVAFKSSNVTFSSIMYQTLSGASGANEATGIGGINAMQIGLGVATGSTTMSITSAGAAETTGNPFDLRISDKSTSSFFVVNNGSENVFTKAGSFYVDGTGNLCMTSTGYTVMGWQVDPNTNDIRKDTVTPLKIMSANNQTSSPEFTTLAKCTGVIDNNSTQVNTETGYPMNLIIYDNLGYAYTARFAVQAIDAIAGTYAVNLTDIIDEDGKSILSSDVALGDLFGTGSTTNNQGSGVDITDNYTFTSGKSKSDIKEAIRSNALQGDGTYKYTYYIDAEDLNEQLDLVGDYKLPAGYKVRFMSTKTSVEQAKLELFGARADTGIGGFDLINSSGSKVAEGTYDNTNKKWDVKDTTNAAGTTGETFYNINKTVSVKDYVDLGSVVYSNDREFMGYEFSGDNLKQLCEELNITDPAAAGVDLSSSYYYWPDCASGATVTYDDGSANPVSFTTEFTAIAADGTQADGLTMWTYTYGIERMLEDYSYTQISGKELADQTAADPIFTEEIPSDALVAYNMFTGSFSIETPPTDGFIVQFNTTDGTLSYVGSNNIMEQSLNLSKLEAAGYDGFSDVTIDFSAMLNYNNSGASTATMSGGDANGIGKGKKLGALTGLSVDTSGKIYGSYDNGNTVLIGQIAVAQFANAAGLEATGDNCYKSTLNSGDFDGIGVEITADGSSISTGELEMSNVDLSAEFTQMITTQRGFQANSRIITTSDSMLEELINLKR